MFLSQVFYPKIEIIAYSDTDSEPEDTAPSYSLSGNVPNNSTPTRPESPLFTIQRGAGKEPTADDEQSMAKEKPKQCLIEELD